MTGSPIHSVLSTYFTRPLRRSFNPLAATILTAILLVPASIGAEPLFHRPNSDGTCVNSSHDGGPCRLSASRKTQWNVYRSTSLGIQFSYPNDRKVIAGCRASKNCVALVTKNNRQSGDYVVAFEVFDGNLDTVAVNQAVFHQEGDHWFAKGHNGTYPAEPLSGPGWQGLKATVDCGISDGGVHASAGDCLWVVVSDGKRSLVADTPGALPIDQNTLRAILSARFTSP